MSKQAFCLRDYPIVDIFQIKQDPLQQHAKETTSAPSIFTQYYNALYPLNFQRNLLEVINQSTHAVKAKLKSTAIRIEHKPIDVDYITNFKIKETDEDKGEVKLSNNAKLYESPEVRAIKEKETAEFLAKKQEEKHARQRYLKEIEDKVKLKHDKIRDASIDEEHKRKIQQSELKRNRIRQSIEDVQSRAVERKKILEQSRIESITPDCYLYSKLQKRFQLIQEHDNNSKFKKMKESHSIYIKPMDSIELQQHALMVDKHIEEHEKEIGDKIKQKNKEHAERLKKLLSLHSRSSQKVLTQIENDKIKYTEKEKAKNQMALKIRAYSYIVKETKTPTINEHKLKQRLMQMSKIHTRKREGRSIYELPDYLHSIKFTNPNKTTSDNMQTSGESSLYLPAVQKFDYLKHQRELRKSSKLYRRKFNWESVLNDEDMNSIQKSDFIFNGAKKIETIAKRKEQLMRLKNQNDISKEERITALYLDSIKAKMAILDEL